MRMLVVALLISLAVGLSFTVGCNKPAQPTRPPIALSSLKNVYPYGYSLGPATLTDLKKFKLERFADLAGYPRNWAFHLTITKGENGFPAGMYVTGGPSFGADKEMRRLFHIDKSGKVAVVEDRFEKGVETLVFARGAYGQGMLLSEPQSMRINRLLGDGTLTTFATLGTAPFGPTGLAYGPDNNLYVTDFTSGTVLRLLPDGRSDTFANVPLLARGKSDVTGAKGGSNEPTAFGGGLVVSTFSVRSRDAEPHRLDALYSVSPNGREVRALATGLTGVEFMAVGPGGAFGSDIFVAVHGTDLNGDGGVYKLAPDGTLTPFLTGIDATHVAFDTEGVLGGGMFIADINNPWGAPEFPVSKIWRVVPK
jgi:hypothetical protein